MTERAATLRPFTSHFSAGWLWLTAIALAVALVWGIEQVAVEPLVTGEVYPAFSSLRADPMGAKALYESLNEMPGVTVDRLYKQRQKLASNDAMFVLGVDARGWSTTPLRALQAYENMVADGGRLVIGFLPSRTPAKLPESPPVEIRWKPGFKYRTNLDDYTTGGITRATALYFEPNQEPGDGWRTLTSGPKGAAETIEKSFGKGTIVLVADTFSLSNEGLREQPDVALIVKMAGSATRITFDENHFGVSETGSVTGLMRRYRLQGAAAILLVVAALFLWRSASSLLPAREPAGPTGSNKNSIVGRDALDGLAALLHRGVPEKQLLATCFAEWSKTAPRDRQTESIRAALESHAGSPVEGYRAACQIHTKTT